MKHKRIMMKYYSPKVYLLVFILIFFSGNTFSTNTAGKSNKTMVVVIDPGHGGKDPGAMSKNVREKDVVLGVGLKLGRYINEAFPDVKVIFTRNTDVFVPLIDRSKIANKNKADLFISLHANFCGTPSTRGTETFVLGLHRSEDNLEVAKKENSVILLEKDYTTTYQGFDPNLSESYIMFELTQDIYMDQSLSFADDIQQQFKSKIENSNRGVKQAGFLVLRESSMPSVLVETGFISNASDANFLSSDEGQHTIAKSILEAFKRFKAKNSGSNTTAKEEPTPSKTKTEVIAQNKEVEKKIDTIKQETSNEIQAVKSENKPAEKKATEPEIKQTVLKKPVKTVEKTTLKKEDSTTTATDNSTYFSVQIGANTTPLEPTAANFKGIKEVRREKTDKYYRYYVGKEASLENINPLWTKIKLKFPQSFIVSFVDGKRTIVNP